MTERRAIAGVRMKPFLARPAPWLIAHRGGSALAPENTLAAFEVASRLGADAIETDVHLSADGEVVVFHDEDTLRITGVPGPVQGRTLVELRRLDAGCSFTPDGGRSHPWRGRGLLVPTLAEAFDRFPGMRFNIEAKDFSAAMAEALARVIEEAGREDLVCLGSFDDVQGERLRTRLPRCCHFLPSQAATFHVLAAHAGGDGGPGGYDVADLPLRHESGFTVVDTATVSYFHARGMPVHVWTVDDEGDMRALLAMGVDGIMSDRPDLLKRVLGR